MIGRQVGGVGFWKSHGLRFQLPESPFWRKVWEFVDLGRCWRGRGEGEEEEKRKKEGGGISQKFDTSARRRRGHGGAVRTSADQCGISECRCAASLALKFFLFLDEPAELRSRSSSTQQQRAAHACAACTAAGVSRTLAHCRSRSVRARSALFGASSRVSLRGARRRTQPLRRGTTSVRVGSSAELHLLAGLLAEPSPEARCCCASLPPDAPSGGLLARRDFLQP